MKTITYNPETHVLVPREPSEDMLRSMTDGFISINGDNRSQFNSGYDSMIAAAPQPEPVESKPVMEAILCVSANGLETAWQQKESSWWSSVEPIQKIKLYATPQPDRTAELEATLKVARDALTQFLDPEYNPPSDTGEWRFVLKALAKINEVLK